MLSILCSALSIRGTYVAQQCQGGARSLCHVLKSAQVSRGSTVHSKLRLYRDCGLITLEFHLGTHQAGHVTPSQTGCIMHASQPRNMHEACILTPWPGATSWMAKQHGPAW